VKIGPVDLEMLGLQEIILNTSETYTPPVKFTRRVKIKIATI